MPLISVLVRPLTLTLLTLLVPLGFRAQGETIPVTFTVGGPSSLNVNVAAGLGSDNNSSTVSGTIDADLDLSFVSGQLAVESFTMTGGSLMLDNNMSFSLNVIPIFLSVDVDANGLGGTTSTPAPPGAVAPNATNGVVGQFNASDHQLVINQGTLAVTGDINSTIDLASNVISGSGSPTSPGSLSVTQVGINVPANTTDYDLALTWPIEFTNTDIEVSGNTVTIDVDGTLESTLSMLVVDFLPTNGIIGDVNQNGVLEAIADVEAFVAGWLSTDLPRGVEGYKKGDLNFDRQTDLADALILREALAAQGSSFSFDLLSATPEPSTGLLCAIGGLMLWSRRRRG